MSRNLERAYTSSKGIFPSFYLDSFSSYDEEKNVFRMKVLVLGSL